MKINRICIHPTVGYVLLKNAIKLQEYNLTVSSFQRLMNNIVPLIQYEFFETGMQKWSLLCGLNIELTKKEQYTLECLKKRW